eukprot:m.923379 g.923379  ORF g.923379 m.923379 type:complete len:414 (+) comp109472_c0_seq1:1110-2351(+)
MLLAPKCPSRGCRESARSRVSSLLGWNHVSSIANSHLPFPSCLSRPSAAAKPSFRNLSCFSYSLRLLTLFRPRCERMCFENSNRGQSNSRALANGASKRSSSLKRNCGTTANHQLPQLGPPLPPSPRVPLLRRSRVRQRNHLGHLGTTVMVRRSRLLCLLRAPLPPTVPAARTQPTRQLKVMTGTWSSLGAPSLRLVPSSHTLERARQAPLVDLRALHLAARRRSHIVKSSRIRLHPSRPLSFRRTRRLRFCRRQWSPSLWRQCLRRLPSALLPAPPLQRNPKTPLQQGRLPFQSRPKVDSSPPAHLPAQLIWCTQARTRARSASQPRSLSRRGCSPHSQRSPRCQRSPQAPSNPRQEGRATTRSGRHRPNHLVRHKCLFRCPCTFLSFPRHTSCLLRERSPIVSPRRVANNE